MDNNLIAPHLFWNLPLLAAIKDQNSNYISTTKMLSNFQFNKNTIDETLGLRDENIDGNAANFSEVFIEQDKTLISGQKKLILDVNIWGDKKLRAFLTTKQLLLSNTQEVMGVYFTMDELTEEYLAKMTKLISLDKNIINSSQAENSYEVINTCHKKSLTPREMDCLFYLIRGYTAKMIAKVLCLSHRTIEDHVERLKLKFNCYSKVALIEKAISEGYLYLITKSYLAKPTSLVL